MIQVLNNWAQQGNLASLEILQVHVQLPPHLSEAITRAAFHKAKVVCSAIEKFMHVRINVFGLLSADVYLNSFQISRQCCCLEQQYMVTC